MMMMMILILMILIIEQRQRLVILQILLILRWHWPADLQQHFHDISWKDQPAGAAGESGISSRRVKVKRNS